MLRVEKAQGGLFLCFLAIAGCAVGVRERAASRAPEAPRFVVRAVAPGTSPGADVPAIFEDHTFERISVVEKVTYGVAVGDVDGDGDLDLYHANFGSSIDGRAQADELWLNQYAQTEPPLATFVRAPEGSLPAGDAVASRKAAMGDLDGDGDLDVVVVGSSVDVEEPGRNRLLVNDGSGRFTDRSERLPPAARGGLTCAVELFDLDGDGDLDVFLGNYGPAFRGERNVLLLNRGNLRFRDVSNRLPDDLLATVDADVADLDGKNGLDLVTAEVGSGETNRVYLNDGAGGFTLGPALPVPSAASHGVALARFDQGTTWDLVVANLDGPDHLLLGNGDGSFRPAPAGALPATDGPTTWYGVTDVDGDPAGNLDLWAAKADGHVDRLLLGDGRGRFTDVSEDYGQVRLPAKGEVHNAYRRAGAPGEMPEQAYTHQVVFADLDQDGHPDAVTACGRFEMGETSRIYMNLETTRGEHGWFPYLASNDEGVTTRSVVYYGQAVGDLDRSDDDPRPGAVAVGRGARILLNRDGFLEDVVRREGGKQTHVFRDEACERPNGGVDVTGEAVRLGEVTGDGELDLVEVSWSFGGRFVDRIHRGCGGGRFGRADARRLPDPGRDHNADNLLLFDAEGDGDLDVLTCAIYRPFNRDDPLAVKNRLLINDGKGFFSDETRPRLPADSDRDGTYAAAADDLDGDGDLDLVYANGYNDVPPPNPSPTGMRERVLINQGGAQGGREGVFVSLPGAFPAGVPDENSEDLAIARLDDDRFPDVAIANNAEDALPRIYLNDGAGRFRWNAESLPDVGTGWRHVEVEAGDFDRDGDVDLVYVNQRGARRGALKGAPNPESLSYEPSRRLLFLRNEGGGRFVEWVHADEGFQSYAGDAELLDVDGDGDLDLYVGAWDWKVSRIFLNATRGGHRAPELEAVETPRVSAGVPLELSLRGRHFRPGLELSIRGPAGRAISGGVDWISPRRVSATLVPGLEAGAYKLWLTNPGGKHSAQVELEVVAPLRRLPEVAAVSPERLERGARQRLVVEGRRFRQGTEAAVSGAGVRVLEQERQSYRRLELVVFTEPWAPAGKRDLIFHQPGRGEVATARARLEVPPAPPPRITGVEGSRVARGARRRLVVRGAGFAAGMKVEFVPSSSAAVEVEAVRFVSEAEVEIHVRISPAVPAGRYELRLTRPDAASGSFAGALEVS